MTGFIAFTEWRLGEFFILGSDTAASDPSDSSADWTVIGHNPDTVNDNVRNFQASGLARYVAIYWPLLKNGHTTYGHGFINLQEIEICMYAKHNTGRLVKF